MVQAPDDILKVVVALTVYFLVKIDSGNFGKDTYPPLNDVELCICPTCTRREDISSVGKKLTFCLTFCGVFGFKMP